MTTFALVQRKNLYRQTGYSRSQNSEEDFEEPSRGEHLKKLRKKTEKLNEDDYERLYTSQIGLVFLKPCVRFSTTVYFHTKSDQGSPAQDSRCDLDFFSSY